MRTYSYEYIVEYAFSPEVELHFWKIRAIPCECAFQHLLDHSLTISPQSPVFHSIDGSGNKVQYGESCFKHGHFIIQSTGTVACDTYALPEEVPDDLYLYPSPLTGWDDSLAQWASGKDASQLMADVKEWIDYCPGATGNQTTAMEVFINRKGVCQDYAHLLVTACRAAGIHARYVNGLTIGEGQTHAWVEVYEDGQWIGLDPTAGRRIDYDYIKIAHGRDVGDCPSNRGCIRPFTCESMNVHVHVRIMP